MSHPNALMSPSLQRSQKSEMFSVGDNNCKNKSLDAVLVIPWNIWFKVQVVLVLHSFAGMALANLNQFLIYALFFGLTPFVGCALWRCRARMQLAGPSLELHQSLCTRSVRPHGLFVAFNGFFVLPTNAMKMEPIKEQNKNCTMTNNCRKWPSSNISESEFNHLWWWCGKSVTSDKQRIYKQTNWDDYEW